MAFRRSGAIVFLLLLYLFAAKIGSTFGQTLTIFSVFVWMIAAGLFVYLILYRGMRLSLFGRKAEAAEDLDGEFEDEEEHEAEVVTLVPHRSE